MYEIEITTKGRKQIAKCANEDQAKIADGIDALAINPMPNGGDRKKLKTAKSHPNCYRLRIGRSLRVVYQLDTKADPKTLLVLLAGHRQWVYKSAGWIKDAD